MLKRKNQLKLYFWSQEEMSSSGLKQWTPKNRHRVKRIVYKPALRVDIPVSRLTNKRKICELAKELLGQGTWIMRGLSKGKTKRHYKWVRLAKIEVSEESEELRARISDTKRLSRYWFWSEDYGTKSVY